MNFLLKNFLVFVLVMFLLIVLGQWNHPKFQQKALDQGKEMVMQDLAAKGKSGGELVEPADTSKDIIRIVIVEADGARYLYDMSIINPVLVQLTALNLFVSPKVQIVEIETSRP